MAGLALSIEGLTKRFGRVQALDGVDLRLPEGAFVVLLGPAGAGKTTTLRIAAGVEVPDAGRVMIRGRDVTALEPRHRDVAMIFDSLALYPNKTGFENIAHPLRIRKLRTDAIVQKVEAVAATLRLSHVLKRLPRTMSGGERQRVALGRALVRDPSLFLLDEPLSSLDAMLRVELRAELKRLQRTQGHAFLLATPDYAEALAVADTVVMIDRGKVRQVAPPQELYDNPGDLTVARFVGAPEINLIEARYEPGEGGGLRLAETVLPAPTRLKARLDGTAKDFIAGIRPEHLVVGAPAPLTVGARIMDVEPLGLQSCVTLNAGTAVLRVTMPTAMAKDMEPGEAVGLRPDLARLLAFDRQDGMRLA